MNFFRNISSTSCIEHFLTFQLRLYCRCFFFWLDKRTTWLSLRSTCVFVFSLLTNFSPRYQSVKFANCTICCFFFHTNRITDYQFFSRRVVVSILMYGCTTWTLTKRLEKKLNGNYTRLLRAILNNSWQQHPTKHQLYGHQSPITKTIQVRRTRYAGHCWRSRDELISDVLLWTPIYRRANAGRPARTYIQQLCEDTGCSPEDLPEAMNDK